MFYFYYYLRIYKNIYTTFAFINTDSIIDVSLLHFIIILLFNLSINLFCKYLMFVSLMHF